jgi:cephalosporin-C deacetylase-like acetyl esterase
LNNKATFGIADIPYLCEYRKYFKITYWQEVSTWFELYPKSRWKTILNTLSYFDTKNFAKKKLSAQYGWASDFKMMFVLHQQAL